MPGKLLSDVRMNVCLCQPRGKGMAQRMKAASPWLPGWASALLWHSGFGHKRIELARYRPRGLGGEQGKKPFSLSLQPAVDRGGHWDGKDRSGLGSLHCNLAVSHIVRLQR